MKKVNDLTGIKESDTGLAPPALWDLAADKQTLQNEQPLQVSALFRIIWTKGKDFLDMKVVKGVDASFIFIYLISNFFFIVQMNWIE